MVLSRLRDWRKTVAEKEGVPVSVLLTNEQPTQMVPKQVKSNACLKEIEGVGEGAGGEIRTQVWFAPSLAEIPVAKVNDYTYHLDRKLPVISRAVFLLMM